MRKVIVSVLGLTITLCSSLVTAGVLSHQIVSATSSTPQALTQTTFTYQANGDLASQILSWQKAPSDPAKSLNNVKQTSTEVLLRNASASNASAKGACQVAFAALPTALQRQKNYLLCINHSQYRQLTPGNNSTATLVTHLSYIDIRNHEVLAKFNPVGTATVYSYDVLERRTVLERLSKTGRLLAKTTFGYVMASDSANLSGDNEVTVTYLNQGGVTATDDFKKRTLFDALGRLVAKQINTCPDGPSAVAIPGCTAVNYGAVAINTSYQDGFRTLTRYSYQTQQHGQIIPQLTLQSSSDAAGATTTYQYDALGRQIAKTITEQSAFGATLTSVTEGTLYDAVDNLQLSYPQLNAAVNSGDSHVVRVRYLNTSGKVAKTRLIPLSKLQQYMANARGIPGGQLFLPANRGALMDTLVNPPTTLMGWGQTTKYNGLLQKQQVTDGFGSSQYQYNERGLADRMVNSANLLNKPQMEDPRSDYQQTALGYNLLGQLIQSQTTNSSPGTTLTHVGAIHRYNSLGQLAELSFNGQSGPTLDTHFSYDGTGQLIKRVDNYAHLTYCRTYNGLGQLVESWDQSWSGLSASPNCADPGFSRENDKVWHYYSLANADRQPVGKLAYVAFANNSQADMATALTDTYYPDGTLKQLSYPGGTRISYQYNGLGQVTRVTNTSAQGTSLNSYTHGSGTRHQLLAVSTTAGSAQGTIQVSYTYNDQGNPVKIGRSAPHNQVTTVKTYNHYDLLATSTVSQRGAEQQQIVYLYTQGQLTQTITLHRQIDDVDYFNQTKRYYYDGLNRLIATETGPWLSNAWRQLVRYQLDANNNITQIEESRNGKLVSSISRSYNGADQLINQNGSSGLWTPTYGLSGNLTNPPSGGTYSYNHLNQLTRVNKDGQITTYHYYANGALASEVQGSDRLTFYYGGQGQLARVRDSQGNWASYLGGLRREGVIYHHADGSQRALFYAYQGKTPSGWLTGEDKTTSWQQRDPYGLSEGVYQPTKPSSSSSLSLADNPHLIGFNGNYQGPISSEVFMGARLYNAQLQSFMQLDSADVSNRYGYAKSNPIDNWDPSGHMAAWKGWLINIGVTIGITVAAALAFYFIGPSIAAIMALPEDLAEEELDVVLGEEIESTFKLKSATNVVDPEIANTNDSLPPPKISSKAPVKVVEKGVMQMSYTTELGDSTMSFESTEVASYRSSGPESFLFRPRSSDFIFKENLPQLMDDTPRNFVNEAEDNAFADEIDPMKQVFEAKRFGNTRT
jgi:RHS repeat-associated protein